MGRMGIVIRNRAVERRGRREGYIVKTEEKHKSRTLQVRDGSVSRLYQKLGPSRLQLSQTLRVVSVG